MLLGRTFHCRYVLAWLLGKLKAQVLLMLRIRERLDD